MKVKLVFILLSVCVIAVVSVLFSIFYVRLSPAHANEFEDVFICGTTSQAWMYPESYAVEVLDAALLEQHEEGLNLFKNNCAVCHSMREDIVGPGLAGITQRRDSSWLYSYIRNSEKMVASGDTAAIKLRADYENMIMPAFAFSDAEIDQIIGYLNLYKVQE